MTITKLGAYLRKLRIANGEILKDMADKLEVSSAFLSAVENGKKKNPDNWLEKIKFLYCLSDKEVSELEKSILESRDVLELNIKNVPSANKELAVSFARQFGEMDKTTAKEMLAFLNQKQNKEK